jgi:hypothetical protein
MPTEPNRTAERVMELACPSTPAVTRPRPSTHRARRAAILARLVEDASVAPDEYAERWLSGRGAE